MGYKFEVPNDCLFALQRAVERQIYEKRGALRRANSKGIAKYICDGRKRLKSAERLHRAFEKQLGDEVRRLAEEYGIKGVDK